jgi:hypothetical protein
MAHSAAVYEPSGCAVGSLRASSRSIRPCFSRKAWAQRMSHLTLFIGSHPCSVIAGCVITASATTPTKRGRTTCSWAHAPSRARRDETGRRERDGTARGRWASGRRVVVAARGGGGAWWWWWWWRVAAGGARRRAARVPLRKRGGVMPWVEGV